MSLADAPPPDPTPPRHPPAINYVLGFLLVGAAWGLTTPFIRRAARSHRPRRHPALDRAVAAAAAVAAPPPSSLSPPSASSSASGSLVRRLRARAYAAFFAVVDLLLNPRYAVPLLINLTGSVWFFLLIGKAELSLTVPIVNTLAFLFTVVGEWWVERKVISRETMLGMVLSLAGIALCVHSKNS